MQRFSKNYFEYTPVVETTSKEVYNYDNASVYTNKLFLHIYDYWLTQYKD